MKQTEKKRQLKEKEQGPARLCYCCSAAVLQAAAVQYQPATNADHTETEAKQQQPTGSSSTNEAENNMLPIRALSASATIQTS